MQNAKGDLIMTLKEAHTLYSEEFPNKPVKLPKFCVS
jgi:hypothetical protein